MTSTPSADRPDRPGRAGRADQPGLTPTVQPTPATRLSDALTAFAEARQSSQNEARRSLGIGEMDARALAYLEQNPGARPSALRAHLGLTSAGVSTLCDRLLERGAIHRDTDPTDRRASLLTVTVDLSAEPWNRLSEFDTSLESAVAHEADAETLERLAELLTHALGMTTGHNGQAG
ncbi:MarR family transcriptional regulator [Pseudoclavibacter sp. AY1F1]|uniref:MarR family winged helix-turn-helix transcriptional regulator n=1 Tax=Pseudoclavibacter sp. AY1F1 TaxID=2080583 RepID=UPI000CE7F298|nr:helix-turn-helix domain-containing protein [Pseudoclavibacter sp. AY1F1]PPF45327.1 MarR family transcriptional regulator [Pseudoclavibacter sp. AY1F1]